MDCCDTPILTVLSSVENHIILAMVINALKHNIILVEFSLSCPQSLLVIKTYYGPYLKAESGNMQISCKTNFCLIHTKV